MGVLVGIGFGLFSIFLSRTGPDSGMWPLVPARVASLAAVAIGGLLLGLPLIPRAGVRAVAAFVGVIDMLANVLFLLAVRRGLLSLVAVVIALYPAVTVIGARLVFREPIYRSQLAGLALAAASVSLIAAG
jgi:drug/metabolite transporter (DMT)-like permease